MTGTEVLIGQAISGIAVPIFQTLWASGGKSLGVLGKNLNETVQLIYGASKRYAQNYTKRHCTLKVLWMREPMDLESVYTAVQLLHEHDISRFTSVEALENTYRQSEGRRYQSREIAKQIGINAANNKQYLMLLGGPGAGKSTFLRKIGLEALKGKKGNYLYQCIPVFIELKRFTSSKINIEKNIAEEFAICGFPWAGEFTSKALEQGKLLILLDGLDEVPTKNMYPVISQIHDFVDRYAQNRFLASCRTAAYRGNFRQFTDVAIADFDDSQIKQFICNWFQSEEDKKTGSAQKCWELLQKPENSGAKELAQTPLLLTFLCLVYDKSQNLPDNRSSLYRKALRILLEEWASEKRILREEIYQGLHTELEEILLSEIAYQGFEKDRLFFDQREIVEQIKTFLAGNLNAPQHLNVEAVLDAIAVQQGILVERAEDIFSFSHLTLQEYLTAQYIDDHRQFEKLVAEHLTDKRWREVFLLVAGLMRSGADELLLLMEKEAQKCINTSKLQALLCWAQEATVDSESDLKPVAKRAIANAYAIVIAYAIAYAITNTNTHAYAIAITYAYAIAHAHAYVLTYYGDGNTNTKAYSISHAYTITNAHANTNAYAYAIAHAHNNTIAHAIAHAMDDARELEELKIFREVNFTMLIARLKILEAQVPDAQQPQKVRRKFAKCILQTWLHAFNLKPELINLYPAEAKAINNYLYANLLILQCKQAAVRVSPKTWEGIEERMLTVPNN
ncbi:MAG: NACHT domain-containing protein [Symploca sp. SIO2E9]|nr:NACHT domain-containing protein [Symploca sp. SIO2E9]